jgi:hypothetical protein
MGPFYISVPGVYAVYHDRIRMLVGASHLGHRPYKGWKDFEIWEAQQSMRQDGTRYKPPNSYYTCFQDPRGTLQTR